MKRWNVSKKWLSFFKTPIFLITLFISGLIIASFLTSQKTFLSTALILSTAACILAIFQAKKILIPVLIIILGVSYLWLFQTLEKNINIGCSDVFVSSNPVYDGNTAKFAVKDRSGKRAFVNLKTAERFEYSDQINLCFTSEDAKLQTGSYGRYLKARYLTDELINNPQIKLVGNGRSVLRYLYGFATEVSNILTSIFPGDEGSLSKGLILGGSQGFSPSFMRALRGSGTSHLVAVSGYNVSIITIVLFQVIRQTFSRRAAIVTTLIVLLTFCLLTGATASVLRASLMGFLYILAKIIGRRGAIVNSLFVAALIMVLINPFSIWDVGFQLSFFATLGLVLLEQPLRIIFERFAKLPQVFLTSMTATLSAQIFTLPILLSQFGQVSILSPIANTLILPFVPIAMLMVAITVVAHQIIPIIGTFFAGLTEILLGYIIFIINFFGNASFSALTIDAMPIIYFVILYIGVILLTIWIKTKAKKITRNTDGQSF